MEQITDQDILDLSLLPSPELTIFLTRLRYQINEVNKLVTITAAVKRLEDQLHNTLESNDTDAIQQRLKMQEQLKQLEHDLCFLSDNNKEY